MNANPALLPLTERHAHTRCAELRRAIIRYKAARTRFNNTGRKPIGPASHWLTRAENDLVAATIHATRALYIAQAVR